MASIDVPCVNQECDSEDVVILRSDVLLNGFKHSLKCNFCNTTFSLLTAIDDTIIPEEDES